jgi:hypothetical protein
MGQESHMKNVSGIGMPKAGFKETMIKSMLKNIDAARLLNRFIDQMDRLMTPEHQETMRRIMENTKGIHFQVTPDGAVDFKIEFK